MRRLFCLGVMVSTGLVAACSSDSSNGGKGGAGGAGGLGAAAGTNGRAGAGGAAGQAAGGAAGQAAGGAAGQAAGGAAGQAAGGAAGQSAGGAAGQAAGGAAGQAAGGAGGSAAVTCLDPSTYASSFTIADSGFCAVALYTASESIGFTAAPTWGSHGGPLVVQTATTGAAGSSGTGVTLERWTAPTGTTGAMTVQATSIASVLPAKTFLGSQAVDLPFFGWTAISWTNSYPITTGQFEMITGGAIATTYDVNGPFGSDGRSRRVVAGATSVLGPLACRYEHDGCKRSLRGGRLHVAGAGPRHGDGLFGIGPGRQLGGQQRTGRWRTRTATSSR